MKFLKIAGFSAAVLMTASLLPSCADSKISESDSTDKVTVKISWWGGEPRHEATLKAIKAFEEKNPDIKAEVQFGAWDGWENMMTASLFAGTEADINQINWNWITEYSSDGSKFLDINKVSDHFDLSNYDETVLSLCTAAGELQAVPVSMTGRIFYWNRTSFEKAGLDVPSSLSELYRAGEIFREKLSDGYYPLALGEYDRMILMVYYLESVYGKAWVSENRLNYSTDEIAEGMRFIMSLEEKHVIPKISKLLGDGAVSLDKDPEWINGRYAGIFEWDSSAPKYIDAVSEGQEIVVGDYFEDIGKYKGGFAKVSLAFAISENTKHPSECARLLDFILNDAEGAELMGAERGVPLSRSGFEACSSKDLLDGMTAQANEKILSWAKFPIDANFEDPRLKGDRNSLYYDVFSGLSYGDYSIEQASGMLYSGICEVLGG